MAVALAHPSTFIDAPRGQLHVAPPGMDGSRYMPPTVRLDTAGDGSPILRYGFDEFDPGWRDRFVTPSGKILDEFIRLPMRSDEAFPEAVAAFASRYGVLGICRHLKPKGHGPCLALQDWDNIGQQPQIAATPVAIVTGRIYLEPIQAWRRYTRQLRGLMGVIGRLQMGEPGLPEDWGAVAAGDPPWPEVPEKRRPGFTAHDHARGFPDFAPPAVAAGDDRATRMRREREEVANAINTWRRYGQIEPEVYWSDGPHARSRFRLGGLPGVLAAWLMAAAQGPVYGCSGCGTPFALPEGRNRPAASKRKWCDGCGRPEQKRRAARSWYARKMAVKSEPDSQVDSQT